MASKKSKLSPNAPKKPATGYILFCADHRNNLPANIKDLPMPEHGKYLGEMWQKASDEVKEKYNEKFRLNMVKYNAEMEEYKKTPEYQADLERKKQGKLSKGGKKIKKPRVKKVSGYNVFMRETYAKKKAAAEASNEKTKEGLNSKEISEQWNAMSKSDKEKYEKMASEINKANKENNVTVPLNESSEED